MLRFFVRIMFFGSLLLFPALAATAAQDEILLAKMKVVREINLGGIYEYEVECEGRGRAILKTSPLRLKAGEAVNLFVQEGIKEGGKPTYLELSSGGAGVYTWGSRNAPPRSFSDGVATIKMGGYWHFFDKNGRIVGQQEFGTAGNFQEDFALAATREGVKFLGKDGKLLPTPRIQPLAFNHHDATGYLDSGFSDGVAIMSSITADDKNITIILDKSGSVTKILKWEIAFAYKFTEGLAAVRSALSPFFFIDKSGNIAIPQQFSAARPFKEGLAGVQIPIGSSNSLMSKWGFIDKTGKMVIDAKYDQVGDFFDGLATVALNGKVGFIDKEGNVRINIIYDRAFPFSDGLAVVQSGLLYGAVDKTGQTVVKFLYENMKPFVNGLAPAKVKKDGFNRHGYGYIDKTGKFVISEQFSNAEPFIDGLALTSQSVDNKVNKYKYINTKGQAALWFYAKEDR